MDLNEKTDSSSAAKDSCGAVGSSMFSIANIRDNILQKLETAESSLTGDDHEVASESDPNVKSSSTDAGTGQGGAEGKAAADEPLSAISPMPSVTNGHVDASTQEAVMGVTLTDLQTDAANASTACAADGCLDTDASDGDTPEAQVTIAADLPVAVPQTGTENSAQEGQVVIKSERPDDGYDLHLTSSAPAELVQLSNSGDAFDDLNVKTEVQDLGCTVDDQNGDDASEVIVLGNGYRNPYSDSESESDASDTSSLSSFEDCGGCDDEVVDARTRGEVYPEELPPMQDLQISIGDDTELVQIGEVSGIVQVLVVIKSTIEHSPLDENTVLFFENRKPLGKVFEVIGKLEHPFYVVRFNSQEDISEKGVEIGLKVYFAPHPAPSEAEITHFIFNIDKLKMQKGSDASWQDNNEPPPGVVEYSDDEEEKRAKAKRKAAKKKRVDRDTPTEKKRHGDSNGGVNGGNQCPPPGNGSSDMASRRHQAPRFGNRNGPSTPSSRPRLPHNVANRNGPPDARPRPCHPPHAANSNNRPFSNSQPFQFQPNRFANQPAQWQRGVNNFGGGFRMASSSFSGSSNTGGTQWPPPPPPPPPFGSPPFPAGQQNNRFAGSPGGYGCFSPPAPPLPPAQQGFEGGQSYGGFGGQPRFVQYNQGQPWPPQPNMGQAPLQQNSWVQGGTCPESGNGWGNF